MHTNVSIYRTDSSQVSELGRAAFQGMSFRGIGGAMLASYTRQLADNSGIIDPEIVYGTTYEPNDFKRIILAGRTFSVMAEFPETKGGERAANYYMGITPGASVLAVIDGLVVIASNQDIGHKIGAAKRLVCCCCGSVTSGRQWHNRDTGFGVCMECIGSNYAGYPATDLRDLHGYRGVHYGLKEA